MRRLAFMFALAACGASPAPSPVAPPVANEAPPPLPPPPPPRIDIDSRDILAREPAAPSALVKHVLFGWAELGKSYSGRLDPRAAKRSQADAARLAEHIAAKLRANPDTLDALIKEHSEDPGSLDGQPYAVVTDTPFVPEFKQLALRLQIGEVGIVKTTFGYHVMVRIAPPPIDPLESADILARTTVATEVEVLDIQITWEGLDPTRDEIAKNRTKAEADTLAADLLANVRNGADMRALMKKFSDAPGADSGKPFLVEADSVMLAPFQNLALRLEVNEAGLVKTKLGWHIIKRLPPPPLDPLESAAILARTTIAQRVKVKHILLGWKDAHAEDPRGTKRTRAQLEKLVKATLKKLAKGADIDAMMAELSEDPGSAKTGEPYEVTPNAGMVKPFLNLSLRLILDEVGVVKTEYGIHIIKRVE